MTKRTPSLVLCELDDPGLPNVESYSPFCLKVHRALAAAGLPYERRHGAHPGVFRAMNPVGQVPVLLVDGRPIADSTRILATIDELSGGALVPKIDGAPHPEAWLWEELADTSLSGFLVAARWADPENWPRVREAYFAAAPSPLRPLIAGMVRKRVLGALVARDVTRGGLDACWTRFSTLLDSLERRAPERGFWLGEAVSVADVAIFGQLESLRTPLTPAQRAQVEARPRLRAYLDRVDATTGRKARGLARAA